MRVPSALLTHYQNGPRATKGDPLIPFEGFGQCVAGLSSNEMIKVSSAIALSLYYADSREDDASNIDAVRIQFRDLLTGLPINHRLDWVSTLVAEMIEYNACLDEQDARNHLRTKWLDHQLGENALSTLVS